MHIKYSSK